MLPIGKLHVAPGNPRSDEDIDRLQIEDLAANIEQHGVLTPLIAFPYEGQFFVTAGGRRLRALRQLVDAGVFTEDSTVPVRLMVQDKAHEAGHAEQLTHVAMSEWDELRVFASSSYARLSDHQLAKVTGRSPLYVQQRREILTLPQHVLDVLWSRAITVDRAIGLTYVKGNPETLGDFLERAQRDRSFGSQRMRQSSLNETKPWSRFGFASLVTLAEYEAEGGRLQADLFTGDPIVLDPGVLRSIALDKARTIAREKHPEAAFIKEVPEGMYSSQIARHPGVSQMTDEQRGEYHALRAKIWQLEEAAEPDEETGEIDAEAEAELAAAQERETELSALAKPVFPDALKAMLGVYYQLTNNGKEPVYLIDRALPDDIAPLVAAGFIEPPKAKDKPETTPEEALEKTSASLEMRIARIKAHAVRMALASSPDTVLGSYVAHISNRLGYTEAFTATPETPNHAEPELACGTSKAWDAMVPLATEMIGRPDAILEMKPAE